MDSALSTPLEVPVNGRDFRGDYPAVPISGEILAEVEAAGKRGETHYVQVPGIPALREAVCHFLATLGLDRPAEDIVITSGEQEGRFLALGAVLGPDGTVAVPEVVHPRARLALEVRHANSLTVEVPRGQRYLPSIPTIERIVDGGSRLLYLESPSRLTGFAYSEGEVERLGELVRAYQADVVWDQTLAPAYLGEYQSLANTAPDRTLAFGSLWPGLGMEAWQLGYILAEPEMRDRLVRGKQILTICTSAPVQKSGVVAADVFGTEHPNLLDQMREMRGEALKKFSHNPALLTSPTASILVVRVDHADEVCDRLDEDWGFLLTDGSQFGAPELVRMTMKPIPEAFEVLELLSQPLNQ